MVGSSSSNDEEISGINVTPLVDIMLVLVIILMVTAEFTKYRTIPIALPRVNASAMKREPDRVALTIKPDGTVYMNDKKMESVETLIPSLKAMKQLKPGLVVILRAEGKTDYHNVLDLLDRVKSAGIAKVGLAVDSPDKKKRG